MSDTRAIRIHETGGAEKLRWESVRLPPLTAGKALVKVEAAGLNFIDIYHRSGLYPLELPAILGLEGAGVVEAVGEGVEHLRAGDKVGYCVAGLGSYAERRVVDADRLIPLPQGIDTEMAAAMLLKGMTAEYLIRRTFPVKAGDTALFHAAAGGVGLIACQWLQQLGAVVIGVVGNEEKAALAKENGCAHVLIGGREDIAQRARDLTDGEGVDVVYDSVGQATFRASLDSLKRARFAGFLWQRFGSRCAFPAGASRRKRLAIFYPPDLDDLLRTDGRHAGQCRGPFLCGPLRREN